MRHFKNLRTPSVSPTRKGFHLCNTLRPHHEPATKGAMFPNPTQSCCQRENGRHVPRQPVMPSNLWGFVCKRAPPTSVGHVLGPCKQTRAAIGPASFSRLLGAVMTSSTPASTSARTRPHLQQRLALLNTTTTDTKPEVWRKS